MAFISSKRSTEPHWFSQAPHAEPLGGGPQTPAGDSGRDVTWFDSSWDLRKGLDVAELNELPVDLGATDAARPSPTLR